MLIAMQVAQVFKAWKKEWEPKWKLVIPVPTVPLCLFETPLD
jgi:hypothetical protein